MDSILSILLGVGFGIAVGAGLSTTGAISDLRSPLALVGLIIAGAVAAVAAIVRDQSIALAAVGGVVGATVAFASLGGFIQAARRRAAAKGATAGLALWISLFELVVIALALVWSPLVILPFLALIWLGVSRRRRETRKYKGLRSLT